MRVIPLEEGMKQFIITSLMIMMFQSVVFAKNNERGNNNFETKKARALTIIAKKHGLLNELESCIASANSHEFMKSCRQKHRQALNALHPKGGSIKRERHRKNRK